MITLPFTPSLFRHSSVRCALSAQSIHPIDTQPVKWFNIIFYVAILFLFFFALVNCFIHCNRFLLFSIICFGCVLFSFSIWSNEIHVFDCAYGRDWETSENKSKQLLSLTVAHNWSQFIRIQYTHMHECNENVHIFLECFRCHGRLDGVSHHTIQR